jgi:hypothetical protein
VELGEYAEHPSTVLSFGHNSVAGDHIAWHSSDVTSVVDAAAAVQVALAVPGASPVHKATIVPRGHALGMVTQVCCCS